MAVQYIKIGISINGSLDFNMGHSLTFYDLADIACSQSSPRSARTMPSSLRRALNEPS